MQTPERYIVYMYDDGWSFFLDNSLSFFFKYLKDDFNSFISCNNLMLIQKEINKKNPLPLPENKKQRIMNIKKH